MTVKGTMPDLKVGQAYPIKDFLSKKSEGTIYLVKNNILYYIVKKSNEEKIKLEKVPTYAFGQLEPVKDLLGLRQFFKADRVPILGDKLSIQIDQTKLRTNSNQLFYLQYTDKNTNEIVKSDIQIKNDQLIISFSDIFSRSTSKGVEDFRIYLESNGQSILINTFNPNFPDKKILMKENSYSRTS